MDSKEYLAPIISPAEALEAFAPGAPPAPAHSAGFAAVLAAAAAAEPPSADADSDGEAPNGLALATRQGGVLSNGAAPLYPRPQGFRCQQENAELLVLCWRTRRASSQVWHLRSVQVSATFNLQ